MRLKQCTPYIFAAAMLAAGGSAIASTAESENAFAALQNVEAQSLTEQEMLAIAGELNASRIAAALTNLATTSSVNRQALQSLAILMKRYPRQVNMVLRMLNLYTP